MLLQLLGGAGVIVGALDLGGPTGGGTRVLLIIGGVVFLFLGAAGTDTGGPGGNGGR